MANENSLRNLKRGNPPTEFHSGREAAEAGRKGGIASGEARRARKSMEELARSLLESDAKMGSRCVKPVSGLMAGLGPDERTLGAAMVAGQLKAGIDGNTNAARFVYELGRQGAAGDAVAKRTAFSPMDLTADLLAPYRAIHGALEGRLPLREIVLKGGRGGGKSVFVAKVAHEVMMGDPLANVVYFRRYKSDLRDTVFAQFKKVIAEDGDPGAWHITNAPMQCEVKATGQRCYFMGADNPMQEKTFTPAVGYVALAVFEECDELAGLSYVHDSELTFLRSNGYEGARQLSVLVFNPPESRQNWANRYAAELGSDPGAEVFDVSYLSVPPEWLGERFLARAEWMREHRPEQYRNRFLGEVTGTGGELFGNVVEEGVSAAQIDAWEMKGITHQGIDWGYEHPSVFIRCAYDPEADAVYIFGEHYQRHANAIQFQEPIREFMGGETICDSAEPGKIRDLLDVGWNAYEAVKQWRGHGRSYAWEWLRSVSRIVVDPDRCPKVLHELQTLEFERLRDGTYTSAYPDEGEDGIMATIYALNRVIMAPKRRIER